MSEEEVGSFLSDNNDLSKNIQIAENDLKEDRNHFSIHESTDNEESKNNQEKLNKSNSSFNKSQKKFYNEDDLFQQDEIINRIYSPKHKIKSTSQKIASENKSKWSPSYSAFQERQEKASKRQNAYRNQEEITDEISQTYNIKMNGKHGLELPPSKVVHQPIQASTKVLYEWTFEKHSSFMKKPVQDKKEEETHIDEEEKKKLKKEMLVREKLRKENNRQSKERTERIFKSIIGISPTISPSRLLIILSRLNLNDGISSSYINRHKEQRSSSSAEEEKNEKKISKICNEEKFENEEEESISSNNTNKSETKEFTYEEDEQSFEESSKEEQTMQEYIMEFTKDGENYSALKLQKLLLDICFNENECPMNIKIKPILVAGLANLEDIILLPKS